MRSDQLFPAAPSTVNPAGSGRCPTAQSTAAPSITWALPAPTSTAPGHAAAAREPARRVPRLHQGAPLPHVPSGEAPATHRHR